MRIRTLEAAEREPLLALLDRWPLSDGWRGADFFRRYLEDDPTYRDENVWVAEEEDTLACCVQIFPRRIRVGGAEVGLGGIGSVFTDPAHRKRGLAEAVLARAERAMAERGLSLGLLFAGVPEFYARRGWHRWPIARVLFAAEAPRAERPDGLVADDFQPARDLDGVIALHAAYSGGRDGCVVRDTALWAASLRVAGNPDEEFRVARRGDRVVAYARAVVLEGMLAVTEVGRAGAPEAAEALAALTADLLRPREPDRLVPPGRSSSDLRKVAFGTALADPALAEALARRGVGLRPFGDPTCMLRVLDRAALCRQAGVAAAAEESDEALLGRLLPPERLFFWTADRF